MADLFNSDPNKKTPDVKAVLNELVGEGKKFQTVEDLAKGKLESDTFIEQLKTEQAALRVQLADLDKKAKEGATLKELMDKLEKAKPNSNGNGDTTPTLSQDELRKLVLATVEDRETKLTRGQNRTKANDSVLQRFGGDAAKAGVYVDSRAKDLGLTKEALGELSETSPSAFAQLLGLQASNVQSRATSDLKTTNTEAFIPSTGAAKDVNYYAALKKTNSKAFWSPSTQQELFKFGKEYGSEALNKILYG
jgi:hypothetical protein